MIDHERLRHDAVVRFRGRGRRCRGRLDRVALRRRVDRYRADPGLGLAVQPELQHDDAFTIPLLVGTLVLVPEQSSTALGLELIVTAVAAGGALLWTTRPGQHSEQEPRWGWLLLRLAPSVTIPAFLLLAGVSLLAGAGGGLYWIAPAVIEAFLGGLFSVWVLLVEIRR